MRKLGLVTVAAFGLALVLAGAAAGTTPRELQLRAQFRQATMLDLGRRGPSIGDEQVASGTLVNAMHRAVGRFGFTCMWVALAKGNAQESCSGWGALHDGQVIVAGTSNSRDNDHIWAIIGGTGVYQGAHGQVQIHDVSDTASNVTLHFA